MAIGGITVGRNARPVIADEVHRMGRHLVISESTLPAEHATPEIGLVATSPFGTSSIHVADGLAVVADADLLNLAELWEQTGEERGSAAQVIAALFRRYGPGLVNRLRGCFSLAIWDGVSRQLWLAVDRFAVKPLFYAVESGQLLFATQARGMFATGRLEKRINPRGLIDYLTYTAVAAPHSAFAGVTKLMPGNCLSWQDGEVRIRQYWDMQYDEAASASEPRLAAEMLEKMEEAVRLAGANLPARETGCFLSGGTDSSSVVGLLTRITKAPVNAFSIGFQEERFNELSYARTAVRHFNSRYHERIIGPADAFRALPRVAAAYDEPFGNSSVLPTFYCLQTAREAGVRVMLAGDGGDELFGGNERYRTDEVFQLYGEVPAALRRTVIEPVLRYLPEFSVLGKAKRYVRTANTPHPERYCAWAMLRRYAPSTILEAGLWPGDIPFDLLASMRAHFDAAPSRAQLNRLLYVDVKMTLGDNDLPKVVRSAEVAGVNVRFPYLDHPLAEFSGHLPARLKVKGLEKRYLFKLATRELLPLEILKKKKHGFGLPVGLWLKADPQWRAFSREVLLDPRTYQRGYFRRSFIESMLANMETDNTTYYGDSLWVFLMLELWHRNHMEASAGTAA